MDLQEAFDAGFEAVRNYVERSFDAYEARLDAIERRFDNLPAPKEVDAEAIVGLAVKAIAPEIAVMRAEIEAIQPAPVLPDIGKMVEEAVSEMKGDLGDLVEAAACEAFEKLEMPKDGVGLTGALIDKAGHLVLTLSSGEVKDIGQVCGKDADPGEVKELEQRIERYSDAVKAASAAALDAYRKQNFRQDFDAYLAEKEASSPAVTAADVSGMIRDAFEQLAPDEGGPSVTLDDVALMIAAEVAKRVGELPVAKDGEPGKDADPAVIKQMVDEAVAALPPAQNGKDCDMAAVEAKLAAGIEAAQAVIADAIAAMPKPQDGKSVTVADVVPVIEDAVKKAIDAIPRPVDGKDGATGERGEKGEQGSKGDAGERGERGEKGADGIGLAGAFQNKDGDLMITLSSGQVVNVGRVMGWDGADIDWDCVKEHLTRMFAEWPKPRDGVDGLGFDDMTEELEDDGRTIVRRFRRGDIVKEFRHKVKAMVYRGVWKEGQQYCPGDVVTCGGQLSHCDVETTDKPDKIGGEKCWSLIVRRGKDGKDADPKSPAKPSPVKL